MSDPQRLKDADGFASDLLRSATADAPSPESRRALGLALGLAPIPVAPIAGGAGGTAGATGATATAAAPTIAAPIAAKVGIPLAVKALATLGLVLGGAAVIKATQGPSGPTNDEIAATRSSPAIVDQTAPRAGAPAAAIPSAPIAVPPAGTPVSPPAIPAAPSGRQDAPRIAAPRTPRVATPPASSAATVAVADEAPATPEVAEPPPAPPARSALADEVELLDVAMAALRRREGPAALLALDRYDRRFPSGVMAQEATVARIQALVITGDRDAARTLGARFLEGHPTSPLADRVRRLLDPP